MCFRLRLSMHTGKRLLIRLDLSAIKLFRDVAYAASDRINLRHKVPNRDRTISINGLRVFTCEMVVDGAEHVKDSEKSLRSGGATPDTGAVNAVCRHDFRHETDVSVRGVKNVQRPVANQKVAKPIREFGKQ